MAQDNLPALARLERLEHFTPVTRLDQRHLVAADVDVRVARGEDRRVPVARTDQPTRGKSIARHLHAVERVEKIRSVVLHRRRADDVFTGGDVRDPVVDGRPGMRPPSANPPAPPTADPAAAMASPEATAVVNAARPAPAATPYVAMEASTAAVAQLDAAVLAAALDVAASADVYARFTA